MKIFIDTADISELEHWLEKGIIDGVTTNPTLLKKAGFDNPVRGWERIIEVIGKHMADPISLSTEVFEDDPTAMVAQARDFVQQLKYPGITIKIPILGLDGSDRLEVIHRLSRIGIAVNATCCIHWTQAYGAAKAGARYVSLLYRRALDVGIDGLDMIRHTRELIDRYALQAEIIGASVREAKDVLLTYEAGAHIVTIPPRLFHPFFFQQKSVDTHRQFLEDAGVLSRETPVQLFPAESAKIVL